MTTKKQKPKKVKLYNFIDDDDGFLFVNHGTMQDVRNEDFFLRLNEYMDSDKDWVIENFKNEEEFEKLVTEAETDDEALKKLIKKTHQLGWKLKLVRTITMKTKKLKLYTFIDNDEEVLIDAGTMQEIRDFFFERLDEDWYEYEMEEEEAEDLMKKAKKSDKALEELIEMTWGASIEHLRTITEKDLK
jgi:hypothetical protein